MDILTPEQVAEAYAALPEREQMMISRRLTRRRSPRPQSDALERQRAASIAKAERRGVERKVGIPTPKDETPPDLDS